MATPTHGTLETFGLRKTPKGRFWIGKCESAGTSTHERKAGSVVGSMALLPSAQRDRVMTQPLEARLGDKVVVLDPEAADALDVQPRLKCHDVACQQRFAGVP